MVNKNLRLKCRCGHVFDGMYGNVCPRCRQKMEIPKQGLIQIYRKGSPLGIANGFGIYIDGVPMGHIGNKQMVNIPVDFGRHNIHVAVGMSRRCTDLVVKVSPEHPIAYAKVYMRPGFWTNSFVVEPAAVEEMPH